MRPRVSAGKRWSAVRNAPICAASRSGSMRVNGRIGKRHAGQFAVADEGIREGGGRLGDVCEVRQPARGASGRAEEGAQSRSATTSPRPRASGSGR